MISIISFFASGFAIILFFATKILENRKGTQYFISRIISRGDFFIRNIYHKIAHAYLQIREKWAFLIKKQASLRLRGLWNKMLSFISEKREAYWKNMRGMRLIKKRGGISEFLRNMSDIEKGNGEINDTYEDDFQSPKKDIK